MQNKDNFVEPIIEIVVFGEQDIVTTSGGSNTNTDGPGGGIVLPEVPIEP